MEMISEQYRHMFKLLI